MRLEFDSGVDLPDGSRARSVAEIFLPPAQRLSTTPLLLFCLPGGGMNRRYFDLQPPAGLSGEAVESSYSFAQQMTSRGYIVASVDHLGVGESTRPADGYVLTAERVTQANINVCVQIMGALRAGTLDPTLPALPASRSVGVGHSMGAMLTVLQQAATPTHIGLALLGFSTRGMPDYVPADVKALAQDPAAVRAQLPTLARKLFGVSYPEIKPATPAGSMFEGSTAEPAGVQAIKAARDVMLPVLAYMSMVPGNVAPEAAQISAPIFLSVGEKDIAGRPHQIPAAFSACPDLTLYVQPGAGHSHFLFASRLALFERLHDWLQGIATRSVAP